MIAPEYDVIVVGARIGGSTVAALLGDAGYRVLLVDRATFPSPTLSTHFFRGGLALSVFKRLGVLDDVLALGSPRLTLGKGRSQPVQIASIAFGGFALREFTGGEHGFALFG